MNTIKETGSMLKKIEAAKKSRTLNSHMNIVAKNTNQWKVVSDIIQAKRKGQFLHTEPWFARNSKRVQITVWSCRTPTN